MRLFGSFALLTLLGGCGQSIAGFWIGDVECQGIPYEFSFDLAKDGGKTYVGSGEQTREFTNSAGQTTNELIEFDLTLTLPEGGNSAQELDTTIVCTYEDTVIFKPGGGDPETVAQGCTARRFDGWSVAWDGDEGMSVADPRGCSGDLVRR